MQHLVLIDGDNQRTSRRMTPPRVRRFTPASHTRRIVTDCRGVIEQSPALDNAVWSDRPRVLELHREPIVRAIVEDATSTPGPASNECSPTGFSEMPRYIRNALKLHAWIVQQQWIVRVAKTCW